MTTIKVCDNDNFRNDVAVAIVDECNPGYHGQGYHYVDPLKGKIYYKEQNALWNPWADDAFVIPLYKLFENPKSNYSDKVDWNLTEIPTEEMMGAYIEEYEPISIDKIDKSEVINFARNYSEEWAKLITFEEENSREEAVAFAKSEILDEIDI